MAIPENQFGSYLTFHVATGAFVEQPSTSYPFPTWGLSSDLLSPALRTAPGTDILLYIFVKKDLASYREHAVIGQKLKIVDDNMYVNWIILLQPYDHHNGVFKFTVRLGK